MTRLSQKLLKMVTDTGGEQPLAGNKVIKNKHISASRAQFHHIFLNQFGKNDLASNKGC